MKKKVEKILSTEEIVENAKILERMDKTLSFLKVPRHLEVTATMGVYFVSPKYHYSCEASVKQRENSKYQKKVRKPNMNILLFTLRNCILTVGRFYLSALPEKLLCLCAKYTSRKKNLPSMPKVKLMR